MIRKIRPDDKPEVLRMMKFFYLSPAVSTDGSEEIFERDIDACLDEDLNGYVFELDEKLAGYAMAAESFCTELGKKCLWIEDLFIIPEYRRQGLAEEFFAFVKKQYPDYAIRLEVEKSNKPARQLYKKLGFDSFPYHELYLEL